MDIQGAHILVTGGAGLIGSTTVDLLLRHHTPARIVVLDDLVRGSRENLAQALHDKRVSLVEGDVCDADTVARACRGVDAVIHLAALRITACAATPRRAVEVMANGTFNVVDAAQRENVKKVVAASSASIYGMAESFPTNERHHPYGDETLYGALKTFLEGLLRSYHAMHGMAFVALRYFNVYGPRMDIHGKYTEVLIRWMERIAEGQPPLILGDGRQTMDFVYVEDAARANVAALRADASCDAFNIASGTETSLRDLAAALCATMGRPGLQPVHGEERRVNPVPRRLADIGKAERLLGFRTATGLEDGLERLVEWWHAVRRLEVAA